MPSRADLGHLQAQEIIDAVRADLDRRGVGGAIAVVDSHGELIAFLRTDGCGLPPTNIAMNKAYTAARLGAESRTVGERLRDEGFPISNFGDPRFVGWGGGVPLIVDGDVVGAVGVSGLSEEEDVDLARIGAAIVTSSVG